MIEAKDTIYDHEALLMELYSMKCKYPFMEFSRVGESLQKRSLPLLRLGKGEKQVFYNGAHHGMEWITAKLLMRFAQDYARGYITGHRICGYDIRRLYQSVSIYVVPMVNPDGVEIAKTVRGWQANSRGVDLNHNYDAGFYEYKELAAQNGIDRPGPTRYPGAYPESEPEARALADFTRRMDFSYVIALHSQGEVIYWQYGAHDPPGARELGERFSRVTGYALDCAEGLSSYSGYKDWFIRETNRPGYTFEVGLGENPLPLSQFQKIYDKILEALVLSDSIL